MGMLLGLITTAMLVSSAGAGLMAIGTGGLGWAGYAMVFGSASLATAGAFTFGCMADLRPRRHNITKALGLAFAVTAIAAPVLPPASMLAALLGAFWWGCLYIALANHTVLERIQP